MAASCLTEPSWLASRHPRRKVGRRLGAVHWIVFGAPIDATSELTSSTAAALQASVQLLTQLINDVLISILDHDESRCSFTDDIVLGFVAALVAMRPERLSA